MKQMIPHLAALLLGLSLPVIAGEAPAQRTRPPRPEGMFAPPGRAITHVKGDVWRANNGGWYVAILDTPDGLLLVDTLNVDYAAWLKEELAKQFPGKPVKYVILSHSHWDHTEGGKIFADTAMFVAQEGFARNMDGRYPQLPGDITDRNDDGWLDAAEFDEPAYERPWYCGGMGAIGPKDPDGDGRITPAQFFVNTPRPNITYSDRMTIRFGGKTIDLVFPGKNHADDGTAVLFRDERVLFTVDFPADALVLDSMRSLPSACGPFDGHPISEWIRSYRTLETLDFDMLIGGHGTVPFTKADISEGRAYFEYLRDQVQAAMSRGESLEQMKQTITLAPYQQWRHFETLRPFNIEAAYQNLQTFR
ncbi:MAG: MBL fold metallo-hydrolase [Nevskiaceae bacterium]|jgi:glyoxylase-like metal-dependent hydrolase (beta-lactamase superfamily II)|nr:MBL fold metallo-hydrolase [Nevskiaceae bacterium]